MMYAYMHADLEKKIETKTAATGHTTRDGKSSEFFLALRYR
jgi:hypothetical protein